MEIHKNGDKWQILRGHTCASIHFDTCQVEDLITVAVERIRELNDKIPCDHNGMAMQDLIKAITWLNERTTDRKRRGVEGTNQT